MEERKEENFPFHTCIITALYVLHITLYKLLSHRSIPGTDASRRPGPNGQGLAQEPAAPAQEEDYLTSETRYRL